MLSLSMAISRALYEGAKCTHACILRSYPCVTHMRNACNTRITCMRNACYTRVTHVRNACDTHTFVKLPLVGTVYTCTLHVHDCNNCNDSPFLEANPEKFNNRIKNKFYYTKVNNDMTPNT